MPTHLVRGTGPFPTELLDAEKAQFTDIHQGALSLEAGKDRLIRLVSPREQLSRRLWENYGWSVLATVTEDVQFRTTPFAVAQLHSTFRAAFLRLDRERDCDMVTIATIRAMRAAVDQYNRYFSTP